jgi:hypothetical protein
LRALDWSSLTARLLMDTKQWSAAREESIDLHHDAQGKTWSGILDALFAYVRADERCRKAMDASLTKDYEAAIEQFGIRIPSVQEESVSDSIRQAHDVFRTANKGYDGVFWEAAEATTDEARLAAIGRLEEYMETETTGFFREEASLLLHRLRLDLSRQGPAFWPIRSPNPPLARRPAGRLDP